VKSVFFSKRTSQDENQCIDAYKDLLGLPAQHYSIGG
jgi:hypothetical protein